MIILERLLIFTLFAHGKLNENSLLIANCAKLKNGCFLSLRI